MKHLSDTELVDRIVADDDRAAFAELVDRHKRGVFALLNRMLDNNEDIEDIAQNVFLAVYRGLPTFKQNSKLSTWVFRITYNQACTALRKMKSQQDRQVHSRGSDEDGTDLMELVIDESADPGSDVLRKQVWKAVAKLPITSRAVVELYYAQGLRYPEIADILNLPLGTVKTHLHRARARLREILTGETGSDQE